MFIKDLFRGYKYKTKIFKLFTCISYNQEHSKHNRTHSIVSNHNLNIKIYMYMVNVILKFVIKKKKKI